MGSIWLYGMLIFFAYRIFNAGMNSKTLFYRPARRYEDVTGPVFEENMMLGYILKTVPTGLFWPIALPMIGFYMLGQRFSKEA